MSHSLPFSREWEHVLRDRRRMPLVLQLAQHCRGGGSLPPTPLVVYSAAHCCQVCCGDEPVKFMIFFFFLMPPFVLSPGACERCLASHSSSDGHPSPHPTTSSPCGFPPSPSSRSSTGIPDDCPFPRRFSPVDFRGFAFRLLSVVARPLLRVSEREA